MSEELYFVFPADSLLPVAKLNPEISHYCSSALLTDIPALLGN